LKGARQFVLIQTATLMLSALPFLAPPQAKAGESVTLTQVVEKTMECYFNRLPGDRSAAEELARELPVPPQFRSPAGVFVTLSKCGRARACWGSVFPEHSNVVRSTVYATVGALTREYRYPPVTAGEWRTLRPQVTVVRSVEPVQRLSSQNPLRDGLMVRAGGKSGVILPGEARDAHYQLVQCRLKAGIKPGEPYQTYRIKADVFR